MKRPLTLSIAALALLASTGACAQPARSEAQSPVEQTREQALERADQMFQRMDANGDGRIDQADREARQKARFDQMDANKDGALSFAEVSQSRDQARPEKPTANGDDARKGPRGERRHGMGRMHHMDRAADANEDVAISREEFRAAALARFDRADANKDGTVDSEEHRALREQRRGQMDGRHRGDRQSGQVG